MLLENLENNAILIVPNSIKEKILLEINNSSKLINVKFMSLDELKKKYYFDYTTESIFFIMKKYNYNYDFACNIIDDLYYVELTDYENDKLNLLVKIKNDLIANNLLIFDDIFKFNIKNKAIYVYGYDYINKFEQKLLKNVGAKIIQAKTNNYTHDIYKFETITEEIEFLANKICEYLLNGTAIKNLKIIKPSSEYLPIINRTFKMFNIPINITNDYLFSLKISQDFLNMLDSDINTTLENLKNTINQNDELALIEYNQIVKICNKYNWCNNFKDIKDLLIAELKMTKIEIPKLNNSIELVELENNYFNDDDIVFLIGFNQANYPKFYKDDDFISDKLKKILGIDSTTEKNEASYKTLIKNIQNIKNLYISYKLQSPFNTYYKSPIIDDLNLKIIKYEPREIHYSILNDKLKLAKELDNYLKYGEKSNDLGILLNTYKIIDYKTYDNQYSKINEDIFRKYLNNKLSLSYSSINNFYRCGFRYYVENILKLQISNNEFNLFIGNLFHYILAMMYNANFDFEKCFEEYCQNNYKVTTSKEKFFINKLKKELIFIIDVIKEQDKYTTFDNYLFEEVVKIDLSKDNYDITFKGIIDKVMYKKDNETLISIIDYKTGNPDLNLNNIIYGLDMQLCIYAYLSSKMKKFANPKLVGIYLQKILNSNFNIEKNKEYLDIRKESLKLQGYSTNDEKILKQFDTTYMDSKLIKSLKIGNNGFYAYSKIFDQAMLNSLLKIVDNNINQARDKILNREFFINPKKIGIKNLVGCENCKYRELCFMMEENIINLKEYKKLEFLKDDAYELN